MPTSTTVWVVRHGRSTANDLFDRAATGGDGPDRMAGRDHDVPLAAVGRAQARSLAGWAGPLPHDEVPALVLTSPYRRARDTLALLLEALPAGHALHRAEVRVDARLQDRLMGTLELLTPRAVSRDHPLEAAARRAQGEHAYRPPGGETFDDVARRVHEVLAELATGPHRHVLVVGHDATVVAAQALATGLTGAALADWARRHPVPNASANRFVHHDGTWSAGPTALTWYTTPAAAGPTPEDRPMPDHDDGVLGAASALPAPTQGEIADHAHAVRVLGLAMASLTGRIARADAPHHAAALKAARDELARARAALRAGDALAVHRWAARAQEVLDGDA